MQSFKEALTEGILAGERALFYAFNFGLRRFEAHHLLVAHASAAAALGRAPPGQWCVRVAWELLEHGCAAQCCDCGACTTVTKHCSRSPLPR